MRRTRRTYLILVLLLVLVLAAVVVGYIYLTRNRPAGEEGGPLAGLTGPVPPTTVPMVRVLVAKVAVPVHTVLTPDFIDLYFEAREMQRTEVGDNVIGAESQLLNKVTLVELQPGDVLYASQFTDATLSDRIPQGKRAVPLQVDRFSGVVGRAVAGDYVDIVFSGQVELHFPQLYPPSTEEPAVYLSPVSLLAVKTILQDIQLLEVIPLTTSASTAQQPGATPTGDEPIAPPPATEWIFILAVDDQQAEILRFVQDQEMAYQLLLRSRDDHLTASTQGVTSKILVEKYGLPKPQLLSYDITPGQLPSGVIP